MGELGVSQVALVVKKRPANTGDARDPGLIPGSGRSLEEEVETTPIFLNGKFHGLYRRKITDFRSLE